MIGYFILLSSLRIFNFPLAKLNMPHFLQIKMVSYFCSHAHRSSFKEVQLFPFEFKYLKHQWPKLFLLQFIIFRTELACVCIFRKYLIWWVLHALCNAGSPGWSPDQLKLPRFFSSCCFPSQSPSWWRDFLLLPTKLMTLMRFISFCIAILVCFVSFLVLQNLNLL